MKRILLVTPSTFGYEDRILTAIRNTGHQAEWIDERIGNTFLGKAATRLGLLRFAPGVVNAHINQIIQKIRDFSAETLLLINPETIKGNHLKDIRDIFPNIEIIVYRWDSLSQKSLDNDVFAAADAVYSFDVEDCENDTRLRHLPLFHSFDKFTKPSKPEEVDFDFSFVGSTQISRIRTLARIRKILDAQGYSYFFYLKAQSRIHEIIFRALALLYGYKGRLTSTALPYEEFLRINRKSARIIDIKFPGQSGLTMRTFEIVFSGTPMLTTNKNALKYDFAECSDITIFDELSCDLPNLDRVKDPDFGALFEKYSIENWVRTLIEKKQYNYYRTGATSKGAPDQTQCA
jgi:hypothetical protein